MFAEPLEKGYYGNMERPLVMAEFEENLNWHLRTKTLGRVARALYPTRIVGHENLPTDQPFVLAVGPHKTYVETVVVPAALSDYEFHILAKESLFKLPIFGKMFTDAGGIPVNRGGGNGPASIPPAIKSVESGFPIIIYPEGTRHKDDAHLHEGRKGAVKIALGAQALIIPAAIRGMTKHSPDRQLSIHIGRPFDPMVALETEREKAGGVLANSIGEQRVADLVMDDIAELAGITYVGREERVLRLARAA